MPNREQRRRQAHNPNVRKVQKRFFTGLNAGRFNVFVNRRTRAGLEVQLYFSKKELQEIGKRVMGDLFNVEEVSARDYIRKAQAQEDAFLSVQNSIDGLFDFTDEQTYARRVNALSMLVQEFKDRAYSYANDPLSLPLESYALNMPEWLVDKTRETPRLRFLMTLPPASLFFSLLSLNLFGIRKKAAVNQAIKDSVVSRWSVSPEADVKVGSRFEKAYYDWLNNAIVLSQRFLIANWLEQIIGSTKKVAEGGSPKAAYLYFTRLARFYVPPTLDTEQRKTVFLKKLGNIVQAMNIGNNRFFKLLHMDTDSVAIYTDVGKVGLDDFLAAIDLEEKRTRYRKIGFQTSFAGFVREAGEPVKDESPGLAYTFKTALGSWSEVFAYVEFYHALQKAGASSRSAGELMVNVPIGQRKSAFAMLKSDPSIVRLYERLREYVDARTYMSFVPEFGSIKVVLDGKKTSISELVGKVAEMQEAGAAWLLKHPDIWQVGADELGKVVGLAQADSPELRLELYRKWKDDPAKKHVVLEIAQRLSPKRVRDIAAALDSVASAKLEGLTNPTLEQLLAIHQPEYVLPVEDVRLEFVQPVQSQEKDRAFVWINAAYANNIPLVAAMLKAHDKVPPHLRYRIRQVDGYMNEHVSASSREEVLMQYAMKISGMSDKLVSYLFGTSHFFEHFLKHAPDDGLVERLEDAVKKKNPYAEVQSVLLPPSNGWRMFPPLKMLNHQPNGSTNGKQPRVVVIEEGVVYRIAVFGYFDDRKQGMIVSKLGGTNIEPVFFTKDVRGTYPECDGVAIFQGASTGLTVPHLSAAQGHYASHSVPTKSMGRIVNVYRVADALIEFRNELFLKSSGKISA